MGSTLALYLMQTKKYNDDNVDYGKDDHDSKKIILVKMKRMMDEGFYKMERD